MGGAYEFGWGSVDDNESVATVEAAVESGINWLDTAPAYGHGHSEQVVGRAIKAISEPDRPLIFTKCGRVPDPHNPAKVRSNLTPQSIRNECDTSLRRLGVDRIDGYQIHRPDRETGTPLEESWQTLSDLANEGKVRYVGLCNVSVNEFISCDEIRHVNTVQVGLNLFRPADTELLAECARRGTAVLAFSPLASGVLSGRFDPSALHADDWRARSPGFAGAQLSERLAAADGVRAVANPMRETVPALSIAWVLAQEHVAASIVGARRPWQLKDWVRASDIALSDSQLAELTALTIH